MDIVNNKNNMKPLKEAVDRAKNRVWISSPWISSSYLRTLFDEKWINSHENMDIRIIIRLREMNDFNFSDIEGILNIADEIGAEVRFTPNLHAKLYIIDDNFAMFGSFNLTGGGYSKIDENINEIRSGGNEEIGSIIEDKEIVEKLVKEYTDIWDNAKNVKTAFDTLGIIIGGDHHRCTYIAYKEIEFGKFVEIYTDEDYSGNKRRFLGKVVKPQSYNMDFSTNNDLTDSIIDNQNNELYEALSVKNPLVRSMKVNMITKEWNKNIRTGTIEILKEIKENGDTIEVVYNTIPVAFGSIIKEAGEDVLKHILPINDYPIGHLVSNVNVNVSLKFDEIMKRHMSVLGSTGSGKSYFTKVFIESFYKWSKKEKKNIRIVVIDTHGEYKDEWGKTMKNKINVIDKDYKDKEEETLDDIYKKLNIDKDLQKEINDRYYYKDKGKTLKEIIEKMIEEVKDEKREKKEEIDEIYNLLEKAEEEYNAGDEDKQETKSSKKSGKKEKKYITNLIKSNYDIISKYFKDAAEEIIENMGKDKLWEIVKKKIESTILSQVNQKEEMLQRMKEYCEINGCKLNQTKKGSSILDDLASDKVNIIDMKDLVLESKRNIVARILHEIFNEAKNNEEFSALVIVDEAQNYAPQGEGKGADSAKVLKQLVSEGRKFGVGVVVITQRPAYVAKDVLSQCNTTALFKLVNENDIKQVEDTVEQASKSLLYTLPTFDVGQCVLTGVGISQPMVVKVRKMG